MLCSQRLMALGKISADKAEAPIKALVCLQNTEMTRAENTIAPSHLLPEQILLLDLLMRLGQ